MAVRTRRQPPRVGQALANSCWAAVLESWSGIDSRIPRQQEQALITRFGEGPTGGITPGTKIPMIAATLHLQWGGFAGASLSDYLLERLQSSHVFCAYREGRFMLSVLVYKFDESRVTFMDPRTASLGSCALNWITLRDPLVLMRR